MKERSSINNSNQTSANSSSSSSSSSTTPSTLKTNNDSTTLVSANTTSSNPTDNSQNFLSPYNSNNFMAPPIGGTIRCVTCLGNNVQGKVIAYDQQTKMLALSINYFNLLLDFIFINYFIYYLIGSPTSKPGNYDYTMVNIAWCSNLEVVEEPSEPPETLSNLNIQKVMI
jgi:hypothetical protein